MAKPRSIAAFVVSCGLLSARPAIDVASIKPSDPGLTAMNNHVSADRFTRIGYAAKTLIENAFGVRDYQVLNAPEWTRSERWTLEIRTTVPTNYQQKFQLLQPLLADRFQLKYHPETRTMPAYSLVIARGGPKLRPANEESPGGFSYNGNQVAGKKYDIRMLAPYLAGGVLNMPVADKTGLTGSYDIDLKWTPDPTHPDFGDVHNPADLPAPDPNRPEIFTAIKEQLGLELKAEKGPVEVIVIDHIERPSPN
jgi:uncharacterized protein (TIGR03435 family)